MWGAALYTADPDDGGTISNNGVTFLTTGTTNGSTFFLAAPVKGVQKEIHLVTSATALSIKTTADTILFNTTAATGIDVGSTNLTAAIAGGVAGSLVLRGLSTTLWSVASNTAGFSS
jgi:hypothetical protein